MRERTVLLTLAKMADNDYLHCDLAPALGKLDEATLKEMEDVQRIMISGAMTQLINVNVRERSWGDVVQIMAENMLLEPMGNIVTRAEQLTKDGTEEFQSDGIVLEVRVAFRVALRSLANMAAGPEVVLQPDQGRGCFGEHQD